MLSTILFLDAEYWMIGLWTTLGVLILVVRLVYNIEYYKNKLLNFITSISHGEFKNLYTPEHKNDSLAKAYTKLQDLYKKMRIEKEKHLLYLKTILEHIDIALICIDDQENIVISNNAAMRLFNRRYLTNTDAIFKIDSELHHHIISINSGEKYLHKFEKNDFKVELAIRATHFKLEERSYKIISLQDIKDELEVQEIESWRKLVRVLTHEIMNTAIPISTLASVTNQLFTDDDGNEKSLDALSLEDSDDLKHSLKTIERRSKGMVEFVSATKSYTNIPSLNKEDINIPDLIKSILSLLQPNIKEQQISLDVHIPNELILNIDEGLIEQVLINLVKNAMESFVDNKPRKILIKLTKVTGKQVILEIVDNGCGMNKKTLENAIVPFYTTKKEGSGIGLSLSQQIMRLHHGSLQIASIPDQGTEVKLIFSID